MTLFHKLFHKPENEKEMKLLYHYLAILNHFIQEKEHIYTNPKGERFVLTKYGFYPVEQYNLQLKVERQERRIQELEQKNKSQDLKIDELMLDVKVSKKQYNELFATHQLLKKRYDKAITGIISLQETLSTTKRELKNQTKTLNYLRKGMLYVIGKSKKRNP
ncbi:hypothetical protein [Flavobacterium aciduliphilum]|nr:hypothetical protein [Flavobacterium aciduliphilum]